MSLESRVIVFMKLDSYRDLIFWQKSHQVVKIILKLMDILPRNLANQVVIKQIFRSSTSVSANIAEGYGRYNGKEYPRFLKNALGSAYENDYWFLLLKELNNTQIDLITSAEKLNLDAINMITKTIKTIELR